MLGLQACTAVSSFFTLPRVFHLFLLGQREAPVWLLSADRLQQGSLIPRCQGYPQIWILRGWPLWFLCEGGGSNSVPDKLTAALVQKVGASVALCSLSSHPSHCGPRDSRYLVSFPLEKPAVAKSEGIFLDSVEKLTKSSSCGPLSK